MFDVQSATNQTDPTTQNEENTIMIDITVTGLSKEFEVGKKILDGLTFQVDQGERVGLLGRNGAGKTTLFKILTGELDADEGEARTAPGKGVGLISQIPVYRCV